MWETCKYLIIIFITSLILLNSSRSYYEFAVFSELCWIIIFTVLSITSTYINDIILFSLPFIILTLTAIEATVIWSLILLRFNFLNK